MYGMIKGKNVFLYFSTKHISMHFIANQLFLTIL